MNSASKDYASMISENVSQIYRMAQQSFNSNKNNTNLSILFIVPSICYAPLCQCLQSTASLSLSVCFSYVFLHNQRGKKKQKLWFIFNPIIPLSDCSICVSALYRHIWYARLLFLQMIFVYATFLGAHGGGGEYVFQTKAMRCEARRVLVILLSCAETFIRSFILARTARICCC